MANVAHSSLTGAELHEPKGADTANAGEVYIADGNGSGSWGSVGTSSFTGAICDFVTPSPPSGWLELDGSDINTSTFAALYDAMTIRQSGTRNNGSAIITTLASTTHMRVGYFVFGTGIASGTTIVSIDSGTQITMSAAASGTGVAEVVVSPWLLNTGTIRLPNVSTNGRYRRSRTSVSHIGTLQGDQNKTHTHSFSGTTNTENAAHNHNFSGNTTGISNNHVHPYTGKANNAVVGTDGPPVGLIWQGDSTVMTGNDQQDHSHGYSGTTNTENQAHAHTYGGTTGAEGGTEARPLSIVVLTCVKT